jgi:hypothetical protein
MSINAFQLGFTATCLSLQMRNCSREGYFGKLFKNLPSFRKVSVNVAGAIAVSI